VGLREYFGFNRDVEDRALTRETVPAAMLSAPPAGSVTPTTALATADVWACVRALSDAAASLPLHVYRHQGDGRERVESRTADLLRSPAPATTTANLISQLVAHLQLHGNGYVGKFRNQDGQVAQLALLHPDRVQPELRAGRPLYTVTGPKGERSVHGPDDVTHVRGMSTDGLVGLSPVRQCRVALGLSNQLAEHASQFFANDARPSGLLKTAGGHPDQLDSLRAAWEEGHRGTANAHRIAVVSGEVDFTAIGMPPDDLQFIQQRKLSAVEVARIFRVPPHLIGADSGESMTYSNVESQALDFARYSLRPALVLIEQALSADRDLFGPREYVEFEMDGLLRADSSTRSEVYTRALDPITGWMTRAEVRKLENLPPEPASADISTVRPVDVVNGNGASA
jgi:HK97 family phage portal protein